MSRRLRSGLAIILALAAASAIAPAGAIGAAAEPGAPPGPGADRLERIRVADCILEAPPELRARLDDLAGRAAAILERVESELGAGAAAPYRIVLIPPGRVEDAALRRLDAEAPPWAAGFLIPARRLGGIRVALADRYPHGDLDSVLAHEATHMVLHDTAGGGLPRWFGEGVATGVERSWGLRDVLVYSSSLLAGPLPALSDLDAAFAASDDRARTAYAASFDFLLWAGGRYGRGFVKRVVREAAALPFPQAWECATGTALSLSEAEWRRGSLLLYRWVPALTGTTAVWSAITFLALLAGARRRARARAILRRWEDEEGPPGDGGAGAPGNPR